MGDLIAENRRTRHAVGFASFWAFFLRTSNRTVLSSSVVPILHMPFARFAYSSSSMGFLFSAPS